MLPAPIVRDWARHLLAYESETVIQSAQTEPPVIRVYEKLRQGLCPLVGVHGFQVIAARALNLAQANVSNLGAVQITAQGELHGFDATEPRTASDKDHEAGVIFIAHLFGLLLALLGSATTQQLVLDVFPCLDAAQEQGFPTPFENMLQEVNQLRSVSERLKVLAGQHPAIGGGLVDISGNIRDIATILDIFAVVKRRSEGSHEEGEMSPQETPYLM